MIWLKFYCFTRHFLIMSILLKCGATFMHFKINKRNGILYTNDNFIINLILL